jgi:methyl-accepting chemotaxis protein
VSASARTTTATLATRVIGEARERGRIFASIAGRLRIGFGILLVLLVIAGAVAWLGMSAMSNAIGETLTTVQDEAHLSFQLTAKVTQSLAAASHYLDARDTASAREFRQLSWSAHRLQRLMGGRASQTPEEIALIAEIDTRFSEMEIHYALAHRLSELGRVDEARLEARSARPLVAALLDDIEQLGQRKAKKVSDASRRLRAETNRRAGTLFLLIAAAVLIAALVVFPTVTSITRPLRLLVAHARRLSEGDLTARTEGRMPGEFQELAGVLNYTGESLSTIVQVVAQAAENVASSANDLAAVSEQISSTSHQMSSAMSDVSTGAEGQARHLREIDTALQTIRERAQGVLQGAEEVNALASAIRDSSLARRSEMERTMAILVDVKATVQSAAAEVAALNVTAADINRFVGSVRRIAEQTNLLALNAAIEAARAGVAGQGFAVVADEVRMLAEQAQSAADDIVQMTGVVTSRVASTSRAMTAGASRVGEIERVSKDIEMALATITDAAEQTRRAATTVTAAAGDNMHAVETAATGISSVARTAEGHAATAEQVSASTEQQSAACEQMNSASAQLLEGSTLLKELVYGLRVKE